MPLKESEALATVRSLRSLIESESEAIEVASTMTPKVVDALEVSGLFKLTTPSAFGGSEAQVSTILDVCEEIAFADGSVGWAYAQNITVGAYAAYCAPGFGQALADARSAAGMFAPVGTAIPEQGGYRVQGSYKFGSGSGHSDLIGGAGLVLDKGVPVPFANGAPPILAFVLPADRVVMKGNWDVMGLRGTGSYDFDVPESGSREATASRYSARVLAQRSFEDVVEACQQGRSNEVRDERIRTAMADSAYITRVVKAAITWAWETSGSHGIRNPSKLQRCFRDIYVAAGHQVFDDRNFVTSARQILGLEL